MTLSVTDVARHICERGGWKVSNLALQKILYLCHMMYAGQSGGDRLVDSAFEAWDMGPVVPSLYRRVKAFGADAIGDVFWDAQPIQDKKVLDVVNPTADLLFKKTPGQLVAITHQPHGAWAKNYRYDARGLVIPHEDILDEYRARAARASSAQPAG